MLTAAVCGDLFASPSVDAVLNAIVAVTGDRGCLLIVKTIPVTGLTLAAAEKAKRYGLKVEMVIVADDIALPTTSSRAALPARRWCTRLRAMQRSTENR